MIEQMDGSYNNPFKFNAKELDEDRGLYYYGARYYNPRLSIWYGVDPMVTKYPNWSPYVYTFDNPIKYTDSDGREPNDIVYYNLMGEEVQRVKSEDTGLYYYGARYYNPRLSIWYGVDPLAVYNPVMETQFYGDGQHNGGVYNWGNLNPYIYCYQNPVAYVDPNGKQSKVTIPIKGYTPKVKSGGGGGLSDLLDFVVSNTVSGPNPIDSVPNSNFKPIPDNKNRKLYLYRSMAESNGHPEVGNVFLRQLGVRNSDLIKDAANDPPAFDDMRVAPGFGEGMSVTPWIAPIACTQFGARPNKPLWRIDVDNLSSNNLYFHQDKKDHANIIPLESTSLGDFRYDIQHSARQWGKYETVNQCP
jgi:RHS repeat-associated protein